MAKKGNNELKKDEKVKHVAEASKKIVKKEKKSQVAKKQNNKPKGGPKAGAGDGQSPTKKVNLTEDLAAKLAIKKAKKAAQKLKKQLKKESNVKDEKDKTEEKTTATKKVKASKPSATKKVQPPQKNENKPKDGSTKKAKKPKIERVPRVPGPDDDESTVFVGNLPVNTKRVQLIKVFDEYGPVRSIRFRSASGKLLFKHKMRKQAGGLIAYVLLKDAETAEKSLALNNIEFKGHHLRVTKATDKRPMDPKRTVFVGNLKYSANEEKLREIFSSCGEIEYVRCLQASPEQIAAKTERNLKAGCKGVAYICFKSPEAVGLALELKETLLDDRPIHVERYSLKKIEVTKTRKEEEQQLTQATKKNKKVVKKEKTEGTESEAKKKAVFHGVKVENTKKKNKSKADKKLKALAKKVAPKTLLQK